MNSNQNDHGFVWTQKIKGLPLIVAFMFIGHSYLTKKANAQIVNAGVQSNAQISDPKAQSKAQIENARFRMREYSKALDMYYTDCNNVYPTTKQGLRALVEKPSNCPNWGPGPYLMKLAQDPWGHDFQYKSDGQTFTIKSLGDGVSGEIALEGK